MKYKLITGILVLLVSTILLMSNALASGGWPIWLNQATLSTPDLNTSQDPENSGYGMDHVVVWEEGNAPNRDIYMAWSPANGALGSWSLPIAVAATPYDEINPAVTVTNAHPVTGLTEVHVVYQRWNSAGGGQWDVCHTWANIPVFVWTVPWVLDAVPMNDATDPAIVFTEDFNFPGPVRGMLVQFVWSEWNPGAGIYEIQYDAEYQDPWSGRGYFGPTLIQGAATIPPATGDCLYPEIASVDETLNPAVYDYYLAIVWQEQIAATLQWNVWYIDGIITISGPPGIVFPSPAGQLNALNFVGDSYHPDIAATHNYLLPVTTYYFHVNWVYNIWGPPTTFQIDTCYTTGIVPTPGAAAFIPTPPATGPGVPALDNPTIASKLANLGPPWQFETWMAWEDLTLPASPPDIWYHVGLSAGGVFVYIPPAAAVVPYGQPGGSIEFNPELWNKNDAMWIWPFPTHLVFDMTSGMGFQEVEYIDP